MLADRRIRTSLLAISADLLLVGIKLLTAWITGSAALLADAYHSITDLAVSLVLLVGLVTRHTQERKGSAAAIERAYRVEAVLAILVAILILLFPVQILREVMDRSPDQIQHIWVGILGVLLCIAIAYFMSRLKSMVGRDTDSPALQADGSHSRMDVFSSIAVLVSLVGLMIGVYLDEIVAIIIALMVVGLGLELLVGGVRSLARGQALEQRSLLEGLTGRLRLAQLLTTLAVSWRGAKRLYRGASKPILIGFLLLAYLASGFRQVPSGHTGVRQVLYQTRELDLQSGLHFAPPWPFGAIRTWDSGFIHSVLLGAAGTRATAGLWEQVNLMSREAGGEELLLATGDENLVQARAVLHYRVPLAVRMRVREPDIPVMMARVAESALAEQIAGRPLTELLEQDLEALGARVVERTRTELEGLGLASDIVGLRILAIQPPPRVVDAYRDVFDALQDKQTLELGAEGQRAAELADAKAESAAMTATAEAESIEQRLRAEGDAAHFAALTQAYRSDPAMIRFNLYLEVVTTRLAGRRIVLTDAAIASSDRRIWGDGLIDGLVSDSAAGRRNRP